MERWDQGLRLRSRGHMRSCVSLREQWGILHCLKKVAYDFAVVRGWKPLQENQNHLLAMNYARPIPHCQCNVKCLIHKILLS